MSADSNTTAPTAASPGVKLDAALITYVGSPTNANFEALYTALAKFLKPLGAQADDLTQDVSMAVWQRVRSGLAIERPVTWLSGLIRGHRRFAKWETVQRRAAEAAVAIKGDETYFERERIEFEDDKARVMSRLTPQEKALCDWLRENDGRLPDGASDLTEVARDTRRKVERIVDEYSLAV